LIKLFISALVIGRITSPFLTSSREKLDSKLPTLSEYAGDSDTFTELLKAQARPLLPSFTIFGFSRLPTPTISPLAFFTVTFN